MEATTGESQTKRERQASVRSTDLSHSARQRQGSNASGRSTLSGIFHSRREQAPSRFTSNINDYELLTDIGGIDDISFLYLAKHGPTSEYVAMKYTDLTLSPDYEFIDEIIRTVRNTNLCKHPNILPYWTTFVENERLWTVTMPMRAGSCRKIMKTSFPEGFTETIVATILKEVLRAIVYLHENHMIHNDIRADNILLDTNGEVRLTGLRQMSSLSQNGEYIESVFSRVGDNIEWAAPEVMAQVDIYSFGITALELAYNRTPFDDWPPLKASSRFLPLHFLALSLIPTFMALSMGYPPYLSHNTFLVALPREQVLLSKLDFDCPSPAGQKLMSHQFFKMVKSCISKDPSARLSAHEILEHPFLKNAKNAHYLESHVIKKQGKEAALGRRLGSSIMAGAFHNDPAFRDQLTNEPICPDLP
ncbi:kinase-like domain-containing protein [Blyttiomyces helicus]|uniref:Kinase-like domain-containing protein n=1 Tax=Blyttiomyces helicus TaxID=388810 RepID=A0A4P9WCQ7_9FUNG|nr:kinase-like domain-containing protein [Blyttiomyces helicus]|eukprot:RKO89393.1 kinase-like domain-containing protein [Blyttiomyces helicus]